MTIEYKLLENDFLTYQLYAASTSQRIKRRRQRGKILVPVIYGCFGLILFFENKPVPAFSVLVLSVLWFFIYPIWEKRYYFKHYQGFVKENNKDQAESPITLEINNAFILAKDRASETKLLSTEVQEINELSTHIFIKLRGGQSLILPKDQIKDIGSVESGLKELAADLKIPYRVDLDWKW